MSKKGIRISDLAFVCGMLSLIVFSHVVLSGYSADASPMSPVLMQGGGVSYNLQVNERATDLEYNARRMLLSLGSAQLSYAASTSSNRFADLHELLSAGYIQPNLTGGTMVSGYSVSFYLPSGKRGFTLTAESQDFTLRSFLMTENQRVVLLTPAVLSDPTEAWETVRAMESELYYTEGSYKYLQSLMLLNYDPPLQVRINAEKSNYILSSLVVADDGFYAVDDSLIYFSSFMSYMIGDTRSLEEFDY